MPSPTGDIVFWLLALEIPGHRRRLVRLRMEPLTRLDEGGGVVVGAVTAFRGTASPLAIEPRRTLRVEAADGDELQVGVDLGPGLPPAPSADRGAALLRDGIIGWGVPRDDDEPEAVVVDLAMAPDATLAIGSSGLVAAARPTCGGATTKSGGRDHRVAADADAARRGRDRRCGDRSSRCPPGSGFVAADGRYLPPLGHRDEVNPGLNEDTGADLVLGGSTYAYVPGRFPIGLPDGAVEVEVVRGFGYRPLRARRSTVDGGRAPLVLPLEAVARPTGWIAVDGHVHFISPTSALLQARAEGVAIVNLLATQWGDHHTSVRRPAGRRRRRHRPGEHLVVMGSENRQNVLGHIGLLGASDAGPADGQRRPAGGADGRSARAG